MSLYTDAIGGAAHPTALPPPIQPKVVGDKFLTAMRWIGAAFVMVEAVRLLIEIRGRYIDPPEETTVETVKENVALP